MADKTKITMTVLIAVVVILASIVIYAFIVSPRISGYIIDKQQEGYNYAVINIAQIATQCQEPIPLIIGQNEQGNEQVIHLVAVECYPNRFPELFEQD